MDRESQIIEYIFDEMPEQERAEFEVLLRTDEDLRREVEVLSQTKVQVKEAMGELYETSLPEISEAIARETWQKKGRMGILSNKILDYFRLRNPYFVEFVFVVGVLVASVVESRDLLQMKFNTATFETLVVEFGPYQIQAGITYIMLAMALLYTLFLMRRIRKEIKMVREFEDGIDINIRTLQKPLLMFKVLYVLMFILIWLRF